MHKEKRFQLWEYAQTEPEQSNSKKKKNGKQKFVLWYGMVW